MENHNNLNLNDIRKRLIDLEDVIIKRLYERSQYKQNVTIYEHSNRNINHSIKYINKYNGSFFDYMFKNLENVYSKLGRYDCFDEKPYYMGLDKSEINRNYNIISDNIIKISNDINYCPWIKIAYMNYINDLCLEGDDNNYGDTVFCDINILQAISKRIHYGILVMECKYLDNKEKYDIHITNKDDISILSELKDIDIENKVLKRVAEKSLKYGFTNPDIVINFFKNTIIPMTIQIEMEYIFIRK